MPQETLSKGLALLAVAIPVTATAQVDVSGQLTVTTDYVFRGVSQTMSSAALQGELGFEHADGWYGYVWASNVDFTSGPAPDDGARFEIDLGAGYSLELTDRLSATFEAARYLYPDTKAGFDYDYTEWHGTVMIDAVHELTVGYSEDVFGSGADGIFYLLATGRELSERVGVRLAAGHYDLDSAFDRSYSYGELAVTGAASAVDWRVSYVATTSGAEKIFGKSNAGERVVLALSLTF